MAIEVNVNQVNNQVAAGSTKSSAPWILGLIGFILAIPNMFCALICAATAATATAVAASDASMSSAEAQAVGEAAGWGVTIGFYLIGLAIPVISFVFGFFGKSQHSKQFGIIVVVLNAIALVWNLVSFNFLGLVVHVLFLCSGISSIGNAKKA